MTKKLDDGSESPQDSNAWTSLLSKSNADAVIIQMDRKEIDIDTPGTPATPATTPASMGTPRLGNTRKENLLSSFHRNLRMSIKAVADSPNTLSR